MGKVNCFEKITLIKAEGKKATSIEKTKIMRCVKCPMCELLPDPNPLCSFRKDDKKIVCKKTGKTVAEGLMLGHEKYVKIPDVCPFL